jgi:uncharacterized RDD family membrane protein YckC
MVIDERKHAMDYKGVGIRFVAVFIDGIVLFVIGYIIALFTGGTTATGFEINGGPAFLTFAIWLAYYIGLEGTRGQTLGKMATGIKVVMADGSPVTMQAAVIRNALRIIDGFLFYLVAAILVWNSSTRQRLGDRVATTYVVSAKQAQQPV